MPEERRISISSSSHLAPDDVARHSFGSARRGYDPSEVRAYLESVAIGLRGLAEREQQLLQELADAEYRAEHPVLDEPTLSAAVGSETARVLHSAHEAASEMVAKAEAEANRLLTEAREEIAQSRADADHRWAEQAAQSEAAAAELRERATQQANAHLEAARLEAGELLARAREECRAMIEEAQGLRTRVLADLSKRRKVLHAQIEQLRAGRERLAETVKDVRRSIEDIADDLFAAEDNARQAAEDAGREALERPDEGTPEELAALLLAEEAAVTRTAAEPVDLVDRAAEDTGGRVDVLTEERITAETEAVAGEVSAEPAAPNGPASPTDEGGIEGPDQGDPSRVEALFARIRADRQAEPAGAPATNGEPPTTEAEAVAPEAAVPAVNGSSGSEPVGPQASGAEPAGTGPEAETGSPDRTARDGDQAATTPAPGGEGPVATEPAETEAGGPPDDRNPLAVRRDELIAPVVTSLSRRLKRTLQNEQNELLDGLRSRGPKWSPDLLPDATEQTDAFATAALPILEEAAEAGFSFAGTRKVAKAPVDQLIGIAHQLAESVVGPLRRRLAADEGLADADESAVAEHIGSAFREWKGERIERLAGDHVVAAFSAGTIAAAKGKKTLPLEWVSDSGAGDTPCPDCEDNGLNGSLQPDEEFPTGHRHPPAHPGCRCLLAVAAT